MNEAIMRKAKELLKEPDMIIDLYDYTIIWTSDRILKITGFTREETEGKQIIDIHSISEEEKRKKLMEHASKPHGFMEVCLKLKGGGSVRMDVEFYNAEIEGGFYHFGTMLKHSKPVRKRQSTQADS
jgi:PAS domain-containing protein